MPNPARCSLYLSGHTAVFGGVCFLQPWSQLIVQTMDNARTPTALSFIHWIVLSTFEQQMPDPRDGAGTTYSLKLKGYESQIQRASTYSLPHRKCGVRGYIHELFVSKPERLRYEHFHFL